LLSSCEILQVLMGVGRVPWGWGGI